MIPAPPPSPDGEDEVVRRLRAALSRAASEVQPDGDAWQRLQQALGEQSPGLGLTARRRRAGLGQRWLPVAAAAAAVLVMAGSATFFRLHRGAPFSGSEQALAANTAAIQAARVHGPHPVVVEPLPIYYVARQGGRWALVREFEPTQLTDPQARLERAVRLAIAGRAHDPDDTSVWRELGLTGNFEVSRESDKRGNPRLVVALAHALIGGPVPDGGPPAALAVQQLVFTVTAVSQTLVPVEVRSSWSSDRQLLGTEPLGIGHDRSEAVRWLAPVWLNSPNEGETLGRGTATVHCEALADPQQPPHWSLQRLAGAGTGTGTGAATTVDGGSLNVVDDQGAATKPGERGACTVHLALPQPGRYVLSVTQRLPAPASSGTVVVDQSAAATWTESRQFTVR